jgi:hypothetical protein
MNQWVQYLGEWVSFLYSLDNLLVAVDHDQEGKASDAEQVPNEVVALVEH